MDSDFRIEIAQSMTEVPAAAWDELAAATPGSTVFQRHAYLLALETQGCAVADTGWQPLLLRLHDASGRLAAACMVYAKSHSMGEYVFDWAWADAHERHGLPYYPKLLAATPFTPVTGARLLGRDRAARKALLAALLGLARRSGLSSLHLLFLTPEDRALCEQAGLLLRQTVQFHWQQPADKPWTDFDAFLGSMNHGKRKKVRQERRKVMEAGVRFRQVSGAQASVEDWAFFARCYNQTYAEHGSSPYLNLGFFRALGQHLPKHVLLLIAEQDGQPIAASLILLDPALGHAYGRYWGALRHVPHLHFEACYYQPLEYCIEHGYTRFEGGAQGVHKMARGLLPVACTSAHWLADARFNAAIENFLQRETLAMNDHMDELREHAPFRKLETVPAAALEAPSPWSAGETRD
ncbi:MAG: GNAT family N-acetyltransferase [Thiomonas sp.]